MNGRVTNHGRYNVFVVDNCAITSGVVGCVAYDASGGDEARRHVDHSCGSCGPMWVARSVRQFEASPLSI